jgi:hypothetical protein
VPIEYRIDAAARIVYSTAKGSISIADALPYVERLRADPAFDPAMSQLFDFSGVTRIDLGTDDLRSMAPANVFGRGARRAFVATNDVSYGVARMFEALVAPAGTELRVFREMEEAKRWLGV